MNKKDCMAVVLAGGRGSRLKELTRNIAKPAVPFGGKYRIIDFVLSNCTNSGIDTVGVLTQYQPHMLQKYIGDGKHWDLQKREGGLTILPPYQCESKERWYQGTAHAVYQNIPFIDDVNPEHVLILSGDHIYKMDYQCLLKQHIKSKADATISVINVPWSEASRFGIMNIDTDTNRITSFEEKPSQPKSNLASMGVYIFRWDILKQYLIKEEKKIDSSKDFGKDIIPAMLSDNKKLYAYEFDNYWRDVGTIESFWEANMDLLNTDTNIFMDDSCGKVYTAPSNHPPFYMDASAQVKHAQINEGCEVYGRVENSVLFTDVKIGRNSKVKNSVLLPGVVIEDNCTIENTVIASNTVIRKGTTSGARDQVTLLFSHGIFQETYWKQTINSTL